MARTVDQEHTTVLVVEDNEQLARMLQRRLLMAGYQRAYVLPTVQQALTWLHAGPVDALVLDILLDPADVYPTGCDAGIAIARQWPTVRLLFMSGLPLEALGALCPEGIPHIQKPFVLEEFLARVAETLLLPPWEPPKEWP